MNLAIITGFLNVYTMSCKEVSVFLVGFNFYLIYYIAQPWLYKVAAVMYVRRLLVIVSTCDVLYFSAAC